MGGGGSSWGGGSGWMWTKKLCFLKNKKKMFSGSGGWGDGVRVDVNEELKFL